MKVFSIDIYRGGGDNNLYLTSKATFLHFFLAFFGKITQLLAQEKEANLAKSTLTPTTQSTPATQFTPFLRFTQFARFAKFTRSALKGSLCK